MGNTSSTPTPAARPRHRTRRQRRWRSSILRHLSLGCVSSSSSTYSVEPWPEVHYEKALLRGSTTPETKPIATLLPAPPTTSSLAYYTTAPRTTLHADSENDAVYAEFIREYPGAYSFLCASGTSAADPTLIRIPPNMDSGQSSENRLRTIGEDGGDICGLYGRVSLSGEPSKGPCRFSELRCSGQYPLRQSQVCYDSIQPIKPLTSALHLFKFQAISGLRQRG